MTRSIRWFSGSIGLLIGLPLLLLTLLCVVMNTDVGRAHVLEWIHQATDGNVSISELTGRFPDRLQVERVEISDREGIWLSLEHVTLDWSPSRLLSGTALVHQLSARRVALDRLPPPGEEPETPGATVSLPVAIDLRLLAVDRIELGPAVAGAAATLALKGSAQLESTLQGTGIISLQRLDQPGDYRISARYDGLRVDAHIQAKEAAQGLVSSLVSLPGLGDLTLEGEVAGPGAALEAHLQLAAGPLQAHADGVINLQQETADLTVHAQSPTMTLNPDLSWQGSRLGLSLQGAWRQPTARGALYVEQLHAGAVRARAITVDAQSTGGEVKLRAAVEGLIAPGLPEAPFAESPLELTGTAHLQQPTRPIAMTVSHPLVSAAAHAEFTDETTGELTLNLPDLAPLMAANGIPVRGRAAVTLQGEITAAGTRLSAQGAVAVTGGDPPWPALIGEHAKLQLTLDADGRRLNLSKLQVDGRAVDLSAAGELGEPATALDFKLALQDLSVFSPRLGGQMSAEGTLSGPTDNLELAARLQGALAVADSPSGPLSAQLHVKGLAQSPSGELLAQGSVDEAPLKLALKLAQVSSGDLNLTIDSLRWKNTHAEGALTLASGAVVPTGHIQVRSSLDDFRRLLDQPLSGQLRASLETRQIRGHPRAVLKAEAENLALDAATRVGQVNLDLQVDDPTQRPVVAGQVVLRDVQTGDTASSLTLTAAGALDSVKLNLSGQAENLAGNAASMESSAVLDTERRALALSSAQLAWKGESLRLLAPTRITFADGLVFDRLSMGLRRAELELAGRIMPQLDMRLAVRNFPADLLALIKPELGMDGTMQVDGRFSGALGRPMGSVKLKVSGLRQRQGPGRALPHADMVADIDLQGTTARVITQLNLGSNANIQLEGQAPLDPGESLDLRATGFADLKLLDPLLSAEGRRMRGTLRLQATAKGMLSDPSVSGQLDLSNGEFQDYGLSSRLTGLSAQLQSDGSRLRITRFQGRAGPGTLAATGTLDLKAPGMPLDLKITAKNAKPLDSDRLSANLDADMSLRGPIVGPLLASGRVRLNRLEITVPERLPATIAVLDVRKPGERPPTEEAAQTPLALDVIVAAPQEVFVRGRGLDTELGGRVRLRGLVTQLQPDGRFEMRRGQLSLAGQTLIFKQGSVGFDGGTLTNPSLNFNAETTGSGVTATLTVGGTAQKPTISLSSAPSLPQDEVLSHLLFGHGITTLSPFEMASIASAVVSLTGISPGSGDYMETVRKGLGLDRLSIGSDQSGSPTLQGGRYIAPGVYVGAKQGATSATTQGTVQVDVADGLKVEGSIGTGSPASGNGTGSVGVIYQFEY